MESPDPDIAALSSALRNATDSRARLAALKQIAHIGPPARGTHEAVREVLRDPESLIRRYALGVLERIGIVWDEDGEKLLTLLEDREKMVRRRAARMTAHQRGVAVAGLAKVSRNGSHKARLLAHEALGQIGPEAKPAIPALMDLYQATIKEHEGYITRHIRYELELIVEVVKRILGNDPAELKIARAQMYKDWTAS